MNSVQSNEEFRWGVAAYQNALFSESVLAFERALSYDPDDTRTYRWLGLTYYRLGYEETALAMWDRVVEAGDSDAKLEYLIETLKYRRSVDRDLEEPVRYVESFTLEGIRPEFTLFTRPSSVFTRPDGGFYLTSYAGNQVIRFNANAAVKERFLGGLGGLDHPFDIVETDDYLFISEALGNTIYRSNHNGQEVLRFGGIGLGAGNLSMPQYLAVDTKGYLYVTESGNRRVSKFDYDGNFILSFGSKTPDFPGLKIPTGIAVHQDQVFVCDQRSRGIYVFDTSGNFLYSIADGTLTAPEGLSVYTEGVLLLADTVDLKFVDIANESVHPIAAEGGAYTKVTRAAVDANGHILATDFSANRLVLLSGIASLYTGLLVEITRIESLEFPRVIAEVRVQTRDGVPVVGLDDSNFLLTERSGSVQNPVMIVPEPTLQARASVIIEHSAALSAHGDIVAASLETLYDGLASIGGMSVYRAGELPVLVGKSTESKRSLIRNVTETETSSTDWRVDAAIKLGASELTGFPGNRAIILFTSGDYGESAFDEMAPDILAAYLRNNDIALYCLYTDPLPTDREVFDYLCEETGGRSFYAYRPQGIVELPGLIGERPSGRYFFQYDSTSRSNFGDAYIPVEAEVMFYKRTGRGGSAYFPPREY